VEGSTWASMSAERPSQQISIENGLPLAGMNPGGMSAREANATSMMLAMSVRTFRLPGLKRSPTGLFLAGKFYQQMQPMRRRVDAVILVWRSKKTVIR